MSFPRRLLSDGEEVVAELRHHWVSLGWPLVAMICALALVAGVAIVFSNVPLWLGDAQLALLLIVAAWLAVRWARRSATSIVLTDRRLLVRTGVFGRKGTAIRLDQITGVSYHQTMVQRMIGSGRVLVETAGDSAGATFYNVRRPAAVQNLVTEQTALQHEVNAGQRFGSSYAPQQAVYQQEFGPQRMVPTQQLDSAQRFGPTVSNSADDVRTAPYQGTAEPVTPPSGVPPPSRAEGRSVATRLQELSDLRRRGLVSDDEYDYKRRQLLDQL